MHKNPKWLKYPYYTFISTRWWLFLQHQTDRTKTLFLGKEMAPWLQVCNVASIGQKQKEWAKKVILIKKRRRRRNTTVVKTWMFDEKKWKRCMYELNGFGVYLDSDAKKWAWVTTIILQLVLYYYYLDDLSEHSRSITKEKQRHRNRI